MKLEEEIDALPKELRARIEARGFKKERLLAWAQAMDIPRDTRNRYAGSVVAPAPSDLVDAPDPESATYREHRERGLDLLKSGKVALLVLAGGMATRMGGVVKSLVEALPGHTFLDLRLAEQDHLASLGAKVSLFLMTSEPTHGPIVSALGARHDGEHVGAFEQCVSLRLTHERTLFRQADGEPSVYATGHGDLPEAFAKSGLCGRFLDRTNGEGLVWMTNVDNLGATVDPAMLGWFASRDERLAVEVVDKVGTDRGGVPVRWNGRPIIAEEFRLPKDLDANAIRVFNTNTFIVEAAALGALDFDFTFVEVDKTVEDRKAVQFERLLGEITDPIAPAFLRVPREGARSRFLPVKDVPELEARRPEIAAALRSRGVIA